MKDANLDRIKNYILSEMIRTHAFYELAASQLYYSAFRKMKQWGGGKDNLIILKKQAEEEVEHYQALKRLHEENWFPIDKITKKRAKNLRLPPLRSKVDVLAASWIFDKAGIYQMQSLKFCSYKPYRDIIKKIYADESKHTSYGKFELVELYRAKKTLEEKEKIKKSATSWLKVSLNCFGTPNSIQDKLSLKFKLKKYNSSQLQKMLIKEFHTIF